MCICIADLRWTCSGELINVFDKDSASRLIYSARGKENLPMDGCSMVALLTMMGHGWEDVICK